MDAHRRILDADEALRGGLANAVHPPDELLPAAMRMAREIADNAAPVSVTLTRQLILRGMTARHPMETHKADSVGTFVRGRSADVIEGVESFLEKRPPRFSQRVPSDLPWFYPWWDEEPFPTWPNL